MVNNHNGQDASLARAVPPSAYDEQGSGRCRSNNPLAGPEPQRDA